MGSTVRRQPITRNVPNAPDYKFLNLTSFGGLNMTDNPFTAPYNTASDCKNVYVDEFNALTTRPRLEKKYDIKAKLPDGSEIVDVHNLVNGYLIHYTANNVYYMQMLLNSGELKTITGEIPTEKCTVFENGDVVYLLDGSSYKNIKNYMISDVEGYLPTTVIGKSIDKKGESFESLNLLNTQYKEEYFWDGSYSLGEIIDDNTTNVENKYISLSESPNLGATQKIKYLPGIKEQETWLGLWNDSLAFHVIDTEGNESAEILQQPDLTGVTYTKLYGDCSDDGSVIAYCYSADNYIVDTYDRFNFMSGLGHLFIYRNNKFYDFEHINNFFSFCNEDLGFSKNKVFVNSDGSVVAVAAAQKFLVLIYDENSDNYVLHEYSYPKDKEFWLRGFSISNDGSTIVLYAKSVSGDTTIYPDELDLMYFVKLDATLTTFTNFIDFTDSNSYYEGCSLSFDGNRFAFSWYDSNDNSRKLRLYNNFRLYYKDFIDLTNCWSRTLAFSKEINKLYVFGKGFIDLINDNKLISFDMKDDYADEEITSIYASDTSLFYQKHNVLNKIRFLYNSTEPLLIITRRITKNTFGYENWYKNRQKLFTAKLITRFQNEWILTANTTLFSTKNNNAEYINLVVDSLGDSNEPITGFNIVEDYLLVAYKKNKLWLIQATDTPYEYYASESKNTVGNTAFGATIITTLTEAPLQINYDGIYTLHQLENVQSSDRISVLISDAISKKWLKESKTTIDNAKTINRLYWTYVVLKDKDKTKIYLLDNRTNSWFYWELPINLLNIFVKDNETHLIDIKGNIYVLTTTDIPSEFVQGKLNYYDDGHKVIDWFWNSQILSLNTINYSKRLVDTTFILTDTDAQDNYSLDYKFKAYRKLVDETDYTTLQNDIKYVQSVTKKTLIPRFKFLQIELSNDKSDDWDDYNKVRLIGLGLKYVLLEVMR